MCAPYRPHKDDRYRTGITRKEGNRINPQRRGLMEERRVADHEKHPDSGHCNQWSHSDSVHANWRESIRSIGVKWLKLDVTRQQSAIDYHDGDDPTQKYPKIHIDVNDIQRKPYYPEVRSS